ncbi:MAG: site-2 protease family protein, partial [candidate division NC10 bacterium]|nr:site-2 protease family protein [candidate division NC10 bacterium]
MIVSAVIALGVLIFIHELGHFLVAKRLGVGVLKFSLGFGKRL